jgi:hypothetical protein
MNDIIWIVSEFVCYICCVVGENVLVSHTFKSTTGYCGGPLLTLIGIDEPNNIVEVSR